MFLTPSPGPFPGESHWVHLKFAALCEILWTDVSVGMSLPSCRETQDPWVLDCIHDYSTLCCPQSPSSPSYSTFFYNVGFGIIPSMACLFVGGSLRPTWDSQTTEDWVNAWLFISLREWVGRISKQCLGTIVFMQIRSEWKFISESKIHSCIFIYSVSFIQHQSDGKF